MTKLATLAILATIFIPSLAFAADGDGATFWQVLLAHLLEIMVTIFSPIVLLLARKLVLVVTDKAGIEMAQQHHRMLDDAVNKGISYAHEQGRKALKSGEEPLEADAKKAAAVQYAADALDNLGLISTGRDALEMYVEAQLNLRRDDPTQAGKLVITNATRPVADAKTVSSTPPPVPK